MQRWPEGSNEPLGGGPACAAAAAAPADSSGSIWSATLEASTTASIAARSALPPESHRGRASGQGYSIRGDVAQPLASDPR